MNNIKLSYSQLRAILGLALENGKIRVRLEDFLTGKSVTLNEIELIGLVRDSGVDLELLRILTGSDPGEIDAVTALKTIDAFFAYWQANGQKLRPWLENLGCVVQVGATPLRGSK